MIALKLTNVKACMSHLLLMDTFDSFLLIEGEIMTFNTFKIDGFIQKNFYTSEELEQMGTLPEYAYWKQLREYCFSLIKGKKTPLGFRFVFSLSPKNIARLMIPPHFNALPVHLSNPSPWTSRWNTPGTTWYRSFSRKKDWISKFCNL